MARPTEDSLIDRFVATLESRAPRPLNIDELVRIHQVEQYDRRLVRSELEARVAQGTLRRIGKTRYQWRRPDVEVEKIPSAKTAGGSPALPGTRTQKRERSPAAIEGHYSRVRAGYGFVEVLDQHASRFPRDILIPAGSESDALDGDRVAVEIIRRDPQRHRAVGRVLAVTERVHEYMVGALRRARHGWLLVPENELLPTIAVVGEHLPEREQEGLVARVRLLHRPAAAVQPTESMARKGRRQQRVEPRASQRQQPPALPEGELEAILGAPDDPDVQFHIIAAEHGLAIEFSPAAIAEAERLPPHPDAADLAGREDLRALPFVTIDGETARDFDDAVCIEAHDDGGFRVWVAIADVSHYVRPRSALDSDARKRGTSVYFPDRAIPMLPPQLSSQLCSLLPNADRLVLVAEMEYDRGGQRQRARFYAAVIRSQARLTYTQVAAQLAARTEVGATADAGVSPLTPSLTAELEVMHRLMGLLYRRRVRAGSLDMDLPEAVVDLTEDGRIAAMRTLDRNDAHRIIEELMLEANRAVAELAAERETAIPYRIHEPPHPDSIDELNQFLGLFGFHVDFEDEVRPNDVQRTLEQMHGHKLERVLTRQLLRSLTKAHYSTHNSGHFGLAFSNYCHFTSPIRRYPDLLVHRQLRQLFAASPKGAPGGSAKRGGGDDEIEADCVHSSQAERTAMEAERDMLDLKKAEFMLQHLHQPGPGTVVSVTDFGLYVELDQYPIEGLVRIDDLSDDRYRLIETERALQGARTNRRIRLGDRVEVECIEASTRTRKIDFHLLGYLERALPAAAEGGERKRERWSGPRKRASERPRGDQKKAKRGSQAGGKAGKRKRRG